MAVKAAEHVAATSGDQVSERVSTPITQTIDLHHAATLKHSKVQGEPLLSPLQQSCMENFLVEGVWAQTRLYEAGYDVQQTCPQCKSC